MQKVSGTSPLISYPVLSCIQTIPYEGKHFWHHKYLLFNIFVTYIIFCILNTKELDSGNFVIFKITGSGVYFSEQPKIYQVANNLLLINVGFSHKNIIKQAGETATLVFLV